MVVVIAYKIELMVLSSYIMNELAHTRDHAHRRSIDRARASCGDGGGVGWWWSNRCWLAIPKCSVRIVGGSSAVPRYLCFFCLVVVGVR